MAEVFDLSPLQKSTQRLAEGLQYCQNHPQDDLLRDGLIQRFKFTYEVSHQTLTRYLKSAFANRQQFDTMTFSDQIMAANEHGLVRGDWPTWKRYRDLRVDVVRSYSESVAREVVSAIPGFLAEAFYLLEQLQRRA
jgi:nucleotidyltransferase substrate binding protein (TIGR01987 family)